MSVLLRRAAVLFACVAAACGGPSEVDELPADFAPDAQTEAAEDVDPWVLIIESGRWGVLMNRAREGAMLKAGADVEREQSDIARIDESLRLAALDLVRLRDVVCGEGVAAPGDPVCAPIQLPYWVLAAPDMGVSLDELQTRSNWVAEASSALIGVGCDAGDEATGAALEDGAPPFCSVE